MNSLINDVKSFGKEISLYNDVNKLTQSIAKEINKNEENVFIIMSNGGFDDIYSKLPIELDKL
jgi:predicted transcriptional regulator